MIEDIYFLDEGKVKITAASVGISRERWTYVKEEDINANKQLELMENNRYDQLPIMPTNGIVTEYFKTLTPNDYTTIIRKTINYEDVIPLDTNIKDIIEKFASNRRTFYFLTFHKNISGLITLGNLNCKQVQIYLFSLICELERELGNFLNSCKTNKQIENWINHKANKNDPNNKYQLILKNYKELSELDLENQLTEHFFLVDFFNIILDLKLYEKLLFSKSKWKGLNSINELRKKIAHPTRSLLDINTDIIQLNKWINKIDDLTFRLITLRKKSSL